MHSLEDRRRADDRFQASYLRTLCEEAGEPFDENLTKAQASERIDVLQARSPRLNEGEAASRSEGERRL